ncbi:MAG: hypothetical protein JO260_08325, partial [Acidobacteria bacterium]|nr:hypothetical protein [Acidobacteriota bacterium]
MSCVFNPSAAIQTQKASVSLGRVNGCTTGSDDNLFQVGAARPDGTFALFRADVNQVEVLTDYAASRTIWYLKTDEIFVAATSQRMILAVV